jgi:nicotinate-nucleotide adenylyltransferase
MPSGERTDKHHDSDSQTRLEMLKLVKHQVFKNNPRLRITDFELRLPTPTQTSRTIGALICQYPSVDFWYVFGVDSYNSMPTWEDGDRLQAELNMVIIKRGDGKLPERNGIRTIETKASSDISSTAVRESAKAGRSLDGLVSPAIKRYIEKHRLYL